MSISATIHFQGINYELTTLVCEMERFLGSQIKLDQEWKKKNHEKVYRTYCAGFYIDCLNQLFEDDGDFHFSKYRYIIGISDDPSARSPSLDYGIHVGNFAKTIAGYCSRRLHDQSIVILGYYDLIQEYDYSNCCACPSSLQEPTESDTRAGD